jgi:hypothetical protein
MSWLDWLLKVALPAVAALVAYRTYRRQTLQSRAEVFFNWNKWFDSEKGFGVGSLEGISDFGKSASILALCDGDDAKLRQVPWEKKEALLAFFEELKLSINSGLIRREVVSYMFGYYVLKIADGKHFWEGDDGEHWEDERNAPYWALWKSLVAEMRREREKEFHPDQLGFDWPWWHWRAWL